LVGGGEILCAGKGKKERFREGIVVRLMGGSVFNQLVIGNCI
jgi:hypothetical protein